MLHRLYGGNLIGPVRFPRANGITSPSTPRGTLLNERELRRIDQLRADQGVIDRAAAWLRHEAIHDQYAGFRNQERAFALAAMLDVLSRQLDDVNEGVRQQAVRSCRDLVGDRREDPRGRRSRRR